MVRENGIIFFFLLSLCTKTALTQSSFDLENGESFNKLSFSLFYLSFYFGIFPRHECSFVCES